MADYKINAVHSHFFYCGESSLASKNVNVFLAGQIPFKFGLYRHTGARGILANQRSPNHHGYS